MSKQYGSRPTKQGRRQDRREEALRREEERRRTTRRTRITIISIVAAVILFAGGIYAYATYANAQSQTPTVANSAYPPIDSVYCDKLEQTTVHYHAHVTIYINGQQTKIPQGVGIASDSSCFYWLHTHDTTGVVHIEAPQIATLNLGNFLDIWGKEFPQSYHDELASSTGWKIYVDGKPVTGDFNKVIFRSHMLITIMYNSPKAPIDTIYSWPASLPQ